MPVNLVGDAIKLEGLEKSFGDWPVLWDLDLTLGWGQFLVLFGANGVGKSTLLRILSTQARADAGKALIAGHDLRRNPQAVRSRVGVVAHQTFLYDDLTALENLVYYGRLFGLNDPEKKADEALSRLGIDRRSGRPERVVVCDRAHHTLQYLSLEGQHLTTLRGYGLPANIDSYKSRPHPPPIFRFKFKSS